MKSGDLILLAVAIYFISKVLSAKKDTCPAGQGSYTVYDVGTDTFSTQCQPLPSGTGL